MKFNYSNDERIEKKSELINVRPYILMQLFAIIVVGLSLFNKNIKFPGFGIALVILLVCNSYIILRFLFLGINLKYLFKKCNDEAIIEFKNKFISQAFNIGVYLTIFLQFILVFVFKNFSNIIYSSLIWFVPSIYATYNYVKKGTLVKPKKDIKNQKINYVIGALVFGILMNLDKIERFQFNFKLILSILLYALVWGIPFYFTMNLLVKISTENSDKEAQ
ncbi:hypothetical protein [Clostridium sp. Ade.TY]|uniref:hypothetical protein n=1 Tax=Clostridium sp. Ade.TY TaxID=1391647 RepID=UPI0003FB6F0F|nr:hypothetical protein [Clostridium sp. Ade.TY]